ncbi:hypothetical protein FRC03_004106 [Tulasnella sp. 419]|nr:hypothetical protein FRC02_008148 [Tulasnella sp. 418]KAG8970724.1 hypothetical protein FRC03_004106 [Tulasnella sp. 419]
MVRCELNSPSRSSSASANSKSPTVVNSQSSSPTIPHLTLKRRRSISPPISSKMSRFAPQPSQTDTWNHPHHHHITDRVVLPPLSTAVDNGRRPSQSTTATSPTAYTSSGSYQYSNTFETARPPSSATSAISSPGLSAVRMDGSDSSYRRPSINRNGSSMVASVRSGATSPLSSVPSFQDPHSINWNIPPPGGAPDSRSSTTYGTYGEYTATDFTGSLTTPDGTPQSPSFAFTSSTYPTQQQNVYMGHPRAHPGLTLAQAAAIASQPTPSPSTTSSLGIDANQQPTSQSALEEELAQLRTKVRELEFVNDLVQLRVVELENEKAKAVGDNNSSSGSSSRSSTVVGSPPPPSPEFQASWDARTEARIKRFCSLNRAGNALCAWHDSRRERRAYPPRMAPPGTLNCGCTFEEALFEESLSRHRVGSYLPGEMVRMDPALRNPLLKLLQWRYGYKDGDFERDPATGKWLPGEGEHMWQQKASSGSSSSRRHKSDNDSA